jgi:hypothetical protein
MPFRISLKAAELSAERLFLENLRSRRRSASLRSAPHRTAPSRADKKREHYDSTCVCESISYTISRYHTPLLRESAIGILMETCVFDCVCFHITPPGI